MHTVLLTRIIPADDDELSRFSLVKKHIAYLRKGIKLWIHPLLQTDEGEVLSFLVSIKIDVLKFFRAENSSAQHIRILLRLLKHLLAYGGYTLDDMVVSRIDYCYNIRIADDHTREVLFRLLQKCPTKAIYTTRGINYATSIYSRSKSKVINVYDKTAERTAKYLTTGSCSDLPQAYEQDIVRMELQIKADHLKYMARRGVRRSVQNWLHMGMECYYLTKLYGMFPQGNFYTLSKAEKIIDASEYRTKMKERLKSFIRIIADKDMDAARAQISYNTYRRYLDMLSAIDVNPITIPDDCDITYIPSPFVFPESVFVTDRKKPFCGI